MRMSRLMGLVNRLSLWLQTYGQWTWFTSTGPDRWRPKMFPTSIVSMVDVAHMNQLVRPFPPDIMSKLTAARRCKGGEGSASTIDRGPVSRSLKTTAASLDEDAVCPRSAPTPLLEA